jgi:hypothetical protein
MFESGLDHISSLGCRRREFCEITGNLEDAFRQVSLITDQVYTLKRPYYFLSHIL